jgi:hypothetical protein
MSVADNWNANTDRCTFSFGACYTNDTGLDGNTFFTGSPNSQVKEIEVFQFFAETSLPQILLACDSGIAFLRHFSTFTLSIVSNIMP